MTETFELIDFSSVKLGDRLRLETTTDCFGGYRNQVTRDGIVVKITQKTIKVELDAGDRIYGETAVLRRSAWYDRQVRRNEGN